MRQTLPLLLLALAAQAPPPDLDRLLAGIASEPERHAGFREERRFAMMAAPLVSGGTLAWRAPAHLEQDTEAPNREKVALDGTRLVLTEGDQVPRVYDIAGRPEAALVDTLRAALAGDAAALRQAYAIGVEGTAAAWTIRLTPIDPAVARLLRGVVIAGAGRDPGLIEATMANGDQQRLTILPPG